MLPNGWKITSLGNICDGQLQTGPFGSQLHAHEYTDSGIAVIMPKDLINNRADVNSAAKIPTERAKILSKHTLQDGDLLFSRRGDVARFALIDEKSKGSLCGTGCLKATPSEQHSSKFLAYFLQKDAVRKWLEQNAVGQTMPNMNTSILMELPLMVASSYVEEEKIAKILSTWDKAITTTQQQKKSLMQQLLTGKKRLLDKNGVRFNKKWKNTLLDDVADMNSGGTPKSTVSEYYDGSIPWVSIADMTQHGQYITHTKRNITHIGLENSSARLYPPNTILYAMYASIGECSISKVELSSSQAILGIRPKTPAVLNFLYLYYYLSSLKEVVKLQGQQGAQSNLNAGMVKNFRFKLPELEEQQKIATVLSAADQKMETQQKILECLEQEKKALMQQLLTGKRRVNIHKDENYVNA